MIDKNMLTGNKLFKGIVFFYVLGDDDTIGSFSMKGSIYFSM